MDPQIKREADDFADDARDFFDYVREQHGDEAAQQFLERVKVRINEMTEATEQ